MCTLYFYLEKSLEYRVFIKFYSKLTTVFRNEDYLPHLVTAEIVTPNSACHLYNLPSNVRAMRLLQYISYSLDGGKKECFDKMLEILQEHGNLHAQGVAEEINRVISEVDSIAMNYNLGSITRTKSDSIGSVVSDKIARSDSMGSINTSISEGKT